MTLTDVGAERPFDFAQGRPARASPVPAFSVFLIA
jgi:hypothetical protein